MAGNDFEYKPQFSRLDASYGHLLLGNGLMDFEWQNYEKSGFFVRDEVKQMASFKDNEGSTYVITGINNSSPKIFKVNE